MMTETQRAALMAAEGAFRRYTHHHITKNDGEKAKANYALADMMAAALAEPEPADKVYAFRRKGMDNFCTCNKARYIELKNKPDIFDVRIFYNSPQRRKPLTDEQVDYIYNEHRGDGGPTAICEQFARAIEAAHGIGGKP